EHGCEAAAEPAVVDLVFGLWAEGFEHGLAFVLGDAGEGQFVVVAEEVHPLAGTGERRELVEPELDGIGALLGEAEEEVAVQREVEERLELVAPAEVVGECREANIDLAEENRVAAPGDREVAHGAQVVVGIAGAAALFVMQEG